MSVGTFRSSYRPYPPPTGERRGWHGGGFHRFHSSLPFGNQNGFIAVGRWAVMHEMPGHSRCHLGGGRGRDGQVRMVGLRLYTIFIVTIIAEVSGLGKIKMSAAGRQSRPSGSIAV